MELGPSIFPKLLVGAFGLAILGFFVRGFSQLVVGHESAELLAAPVFVTAVLLAAAAFVLSLLVKLGLVADPTAE